MLLQRVKYGASSITIDDVMKLATVNGAKLLGFEQTGKGNQAHIEGIM